MRRVCLLLLVLSAACATTMTIPEQTGRFLTQVEQAGVLIPRNYVVPGTSRSSELANLKAWLEKRGWTVKIEPIDQDYCAHCMGVTAHAVGLVLVESQQPLNSQYCTLLHEAAHTLLVPTQNANVHEIIAEMSAYLAAAHVGLNTQAQSFSYLATKGDPEFRDLVLKTYGKQIDAVVQQLVKASQGKP